MRKVLALAGAIAGASLVLSVAAPAASASGRCYQVSFAGVPVLEDYPQTEQCINLPIDPELS